MHGGGLGLLLDQLAEDALGVVVAAAAHQSLALLEALHEALDPRDLLRGERPVRALLGDRDGGRDGDAGDDEQRGNHDAAEDRLHVSSPFGSAGHG